MGARPLHWAAWVFLGLGASSSAGCGSGDDYMREPHLSPVGSGLVALADPDAVAASGLDSLPAPNASLSQNLYTDARISNVGDIVTVIIAINDKATFGNSTDRSQTATLGFSSDYAVTGGASGSAGTLKGDLSSSSSNQGEGNIDRAEQIQVSVPAVVTKVLKNGNLVISGTQELRVNYELRSLAVAGIVHPADISRNNTVAYDRIAEARISYGGRGRITEVQQPSWGQQLYDNIKPF